MIRIASAIVVVGLCLASTPASAQAIQRWVPANSSTWGYAHESGETLIVVGVPGESSVIRVKPRPPFGGEWTLTLLESGEPVRAWSGASNAMLTTDPVLFGAEGAVAVVVQHVGVEGGSY